MEIYRYNPASFIVTNFEIIPIHCVAVKKLYFFSRQHLMNTFIDYVSAESMGTAFHGSGMKIHGSLARIYGLVSIYIFAFDSTNAGRNAQCGGVDEDVPAKLRH